MQGVADTGSDDATYMYDVEDSPLIIETVGGGDLLPSGDYVVVSSMTTTMAGTTVNKCMCRRLEHVTSACSCLDLL